MSQTPERQLNLTYKNLLGSKKSPGADRGWGSNSIGSPTAKTQTPKKNSTLSPKVSNLTPKSPSRSPTKRSSPLKFDEATEYVNRCTATGTEPVLEFVVVLQDTSIPRCVLSKPLTTQKISLISETLKTNQTIHDFEISKNELSTNDLQILGSGLKANKTIKTLSLSENMIQSEALLAFIKEACTNNTIIELNFSNNEIGNHGIAGLAGHWLQQNESVTKLDLHHNKIKAQGAVAIATILKLNKTLQVLNFRFNDFQDTGAQILGAALKVNSSLVELDLGGNMIGYAGARSLVEGLKENKTLKKLNMRQNRIGDVGAKAFAELISNTSLTELYLGVNQIEAAGFIAIAEALKTNTTLVKLDLQAAQLSTAGVLAITDSLLHNRVLRELILDVDKLSEEDIAIFAKGFQKNTTIIELHCDLDKLDKDAASIIKSTLSLNRIVSGLIEKTGFKEHYEQATAMVRQGSTIAPNMQETVPLNTQQSLPPQSIPAPQWGSTLQKLHIQDEPLNTSYADVNTSRTYIEDLAPAATSFNRTAPRSTQQRTAKFAEPEPESTDLPKKVLLRFEEYEFSLKLLRDKVDNSLADIEAGVMREIELKSQDSTQYVIREISKLQSDLQQAHSLDLKRMQDENVTLIRKMKKEVEDSLATMYKKTTSTLSEETQALVKSEVSRQVKSVIMEEMRRFETRDQELLTETIRADYLTKMVDLEKSLRRDQESLRTEFQEIIERATKQVVTTSSEIILTKFQEMHQILASQQAEIATMKVPPPANDYEERIRTLEELVMLQQEEQSKLTKQLKMAVDVINSNSAASNNNNSRPNTPKGTADLQRQFNEKLELLESKFIKEDRKRASHIEERMDLLERMLKEMPVSTRARSPSKGSTSASDLSVKKIEEELKQKQQESLKQIETKNSNFQDRIEKRLGDIYTRINSVEEALRVENETSLQALQALLID